MAEGYSKLAEALQASCPHLSPDILECEAYRLRLTDMAHAATVQDAYRLLGCFDAFCDEIGVDYFAMADTLIAALTYQDFAPGEAMLTIGMLRSDYLAFEAAYLKTAYPSLLQSGISGKRGNDGDISEDTDAPDEGTAYMGGSFQGESEIDGGDAFWDTQPHPSGFFLDGFVDAERTARKCMPAVVLCEPAMVSIDGSAAYGIDHLPLHAKAKILISIFDAVPKDYKLSRAFFHAVKAVCDLADAARGMGAAQLSRTIWEVAGRYNDAPHDSVARLMPKRCRAADLGDLFPTHKVPFGPVQLSCPRVGRPWLLMDVDTMEEQIGYLQKDVLLIAAEIDRICRKHGIGYFVCGGTMLGHVRHDGFIPWDDDMDMGMLRADYERFLEVAAEEIAEPFFLQTRRSDPNVPYLFSKVRLKDTDYITAYNEYRDFDKGICVDIFPFDKVPLEYGTFAAHKARVDDLSREHNTVVNRAMPADTPVDELNGIAEKAASAIVAGRHMYYRSIPLSKTQSAYEEAVTAYNGDENLHYVASFVPTFTCVRLDELLPYQDIEFEGLTLMGAAHPEIFLQMQYGNFESWPPLHRRHGHDLIRWKGTEHSSEEFER